MMKKFKNLLSWLLIFVLSVSLTQPVLADETNVSETESVGYRKISISSMEDFEQFRENCVKDIYSKDLEVTLKTDLDFTGMEFEAVPSFSGIFNGNKHTIKGITLETEGSSQGLFRYLGETALVKDLTVHGDIMPTGTKNNVGGIAGNNAGTIRNCKFMGQAAGTESVGGIVGVNETGGIIEDCMVSGPIRGSHFVGGISGSNYGVIRNCKNLASVNTKEQDNKIESVSLDPDFIMGKEAIETATDLGGIAGTNSGLIRNSVNHGNVGYPRMGYNLGGICGSQKGYITDCKNYGTIQGRKEIAGIAGQLEPVVEISFQEDTLQILRRQLEQTSSLANRASGNIQSGSQSLKGDIHNLHNSADTAVDSIRELLPSEGEWPDHDTIIAAQNSLSSSIGSMQGSLSNINESAQSLVGTAAADIRAINNSIADISRTLDHAADTLGGTITDVSDEDTPEDLTGKIENCQNYGLISGDLNAGGIAGAAAWENDLDPEDDYTVSGSRSFNFDSRLRAVILNCSNSATIQVHKRNAGGIVGNLSLGLVRNCSNTGFIEGENADYLGGIAGTSLGFLRNSNAKCKLTGHSNLGGIAGSASIVSGCRSTAVLDADGERIGSILGTAEEDRTESENPIEGNYYLPLSHHLGAIDGIDYWNQADSLSKSEFLKLPNLSNLFFSASMTFRYPDGSTEKIVVPMGDVVPESKIPAPPRKDGFIGKWDQLEELDLDHLYFNVVLEAAYTPTNKVVESTEKRWDGKPILLAEGSFGDQTTVEIVPYESLPEDREILNCWTLPILNAEEDTVFHLSLPQNLEPENGKILVLNQDMVWEEREAETDGSYLVFTAAPTDLAVAVYASHSAQTAKLLAAGGAAVLILMIVMILRKRKKRKNQQPKA